MAVIRIVEHKNRETIGLLREALEKAERGEITGVCLAMKLDSGLHGIALTGDYYEDPTDVLAVASRIDFEVNLLVRERKGLVDTDFGAMK